MLFVALFVALLFVLGYVLYVYLPRPAPPPSVQGDTTGDFVGTGKLTAVLDPEAMTAERSVVDDAKKKLEDALKKVKENQRTERSGAVAHKVQGDQKERAVVLDIEAARLEAKAQVAQFANQLATLFPEVEVTRTKRAAYYNVKDKAGGKCIDLDRYKQYAEFRWRETVANTALDPAVELPWGAQLLLPDAGTDFTKRRPVEEVLLGDCPANATGQPRGFKIHKNDGKVWSMQTKKFVVLELAWPETHEILAKGSLLIKNT